MKTASRVEIKREIETKFSDFCCVCGHRYEAGSQMVVLTEAPNARGKIAHAECVRKHNEQVAAAEAAAAARKEREEQRRKENERFMQLLGLNPADKE